MTEIEKIEHEKALWTHFLLMGGDPTIATTECFE